MVVLILSRNPPFVRFRTVTCATRGLGQVGQAVPAPQEIEVGARSALDGEPGNARLRLYRSLLPADRRSVNTELPFPLGLAHSEHSQLFGGASREPIRARRLTGAPGARQLSAIRNLDQDPFDCLAAVLFEVDFAVYRAARCRLPSPKHARGVRRVRIVSSSIFATTSGHS